MNFPTCNNDKVNRHRQQQQQPPAINLNDYYALQSSVHDAYLQAFPGMSHEESRHFADRLLKRSFAKATHAKSAVLQQDMEQQEREFKDEVSRESMKMKDVTCRVWADQYQKMGRFMAWNALVILPVVWMACSRAPSDCFLQVRDVTIAGADYLFVDKKVGNWVCPPGPTETTISSWLLLGPWFHQSACTVASVLLFLLLVASCWCLWEWTHGSIAFTVVACAAYCWESLFSDDVYCFCALQLCIHLLVLTLWQLAAAPVLRNVDDITEEVTHTKGFVRYVVFWIYVVVVCLAGFVGYSIFRAITNENDLISPGSRQCVVNPCLIFT